MADVSITREQADRELRVAAIAVEGLRVEVKRLQQERDALKDEREDCLSRWHQIAESEADVKRLTGERDALVRLVRWVNNRGASMGYGLDWIRRHLPEELKPTLDAALSEES